MMEKYCIRQSAWFCLKLLYTNIKTCEFNFDMCRCNKNFTHTSHKNQMKLHYYS
jgi:hypothetical protein